MPSVYAVEDDEGILEVILYALKSAGFEAAGFESSVEFFAAVKDAPPNLILLDIMLPHEDGLSILRKLRSVPQTKMLPVIMLTAKGAELDKVKALDMGADDYIPKPFGVMELISRVNAVLRRTKTESAEEDVITINELTINNVRREVYVDENKVDLTFKEYELLLHLARKQEIALSRENIMNAVWGYGFMGESRTLDMHIRTLRQKLGTAGRFIITIRNVGYKLGLDSVL